MRLSRLGLKPSHTPEAISARLASGPRQIYLKDMVYGAIDGAITTFAIVSGVAGAGLSSGVLIVLGLANLLADGFSMAASNYLGTRSENQYRASMRAREEAEIEVYPEGETEEIRQIFEMKGLSGDALEQMVQTVTSDPRLWVDTMLQEEHGLALEDARPVWSGLVTFVAFILAGALPLITFLINWLRPETFATPFLWSAVITLVSFALVGIIKGRYVNQSYIVSALETILVGSLAAALAYTTGWALQGLVS